MANAHNDPGVDGLKIFNIGYLVGIAGILLAWNSAILIKVTVSEEYLRYTALCLKTKSNSHFPGAIMIAMICLCILFSLITIRRTKTYLNKLHDNQLRNLPAKNAMTYIDTLILFYVLSGSLIIKAFCMLFWIHNTNTSLSDQTNLILCVITIIVDDIGVGFIFPVYIIMKTKRYLPKLWDSSRQIILENNDFFSSNPTAVVPISNSINQSESRF